MLCTMHRHADAGWLMYPVGASWRSHPTSGASFWYNQATFLPGHAIRRPSGNEQEYCLNSSDIVLGCTDLTAFRKNSAILLPGNLTTSEVKYFTLLCLGLVYPDGHIIWLMQPFGPKYQMHRTENRANFGPIDICRKSNWLAVLVVLVCSVQLWQAPRKLPESSSDG